MTTRVGRIEPKRWPREQQDERLIDTFGRLLEAGSALEHNLGAAMEQACGVPHTWFEVLLRVERSQDGLISMGALAAQIALTTGGVTRLVDRMVTAGLVERLPCPTDRRVYYVALTADGRARLAEAKTVHLLGLAQIFDTFSDAELAQLDHLLDRLRPPAAVASPAIGSSLVATPKETEERAP